MNRQYSRTTWESLQFVTIQRTIGVDEPFDVTYRRSSYNISIDWTVWTLNSAEHTVQHTTEHE